MRFLLDTNIVIAMLNGRSEAVARRYAINRADTVLSAMVLHELAFGAFYSDRPIENLRKVHGLGLPTLELAPADAISAGQLRAALRRAGTPIGHYDVLIAGQALSRDLTLVTNNTREFARVDALKLADWSAP